MCPLPLEGPGLALPSHPEECSARSELLPGSSPSLCWVCFGFGEALWKILVSECSCGLGLVFLLFSSVGRTLSPVLVTLCQPAAASASLQGKESQLCGLEHGRRAQ